MSPKTLTLQDDPLNLKSFVCFKRFAAAAETQLRVDACVTNPFDDLRDTSSQLPLPSVRELESNVVVQ